MSEGSLVTYLLNKGWDRIRKSGDFNPATLGIYEKGNHMLIVHTRDGKEGLCSIMLKDVCLNQLAVDASAGLIYMGKLPTPREFKVLWQLLTGDERLIDYSPFPKKEESNGTSINIAS